MAEWTLFAGLISSLVAIGGVLFAAIWNRVTKIEAEMASKISQDQHNEFVLRFNQHRDEGGGRLTRAEFNLYREKPKGR